MCPQEGDGRTSLPRRLHSERNAKQLRPAGGIGDGRAEVSEKSKRGGVRIPPPRRLAGGGVRVGLARRLRKRVRPVGPLEARWHELRITRALARICSALDEVDAIAVQRLPESHVEVYFHARLLAVERVWELDRHRLRTDDRRRTALPREEEGECRGQALFLWPQKNCHPPLQEETLKGGCDRLSRRPPTKPPSSRRIGAQPPKHRA
jgi:hypothetical protein